jgi:hypothetical protein
MTWLIPPRCQHSPDPVLSSELAKLFNTATGAPRDQEVIVQRS